MLGKKLVIVCLTVLATMASANTNAQDQSRFQSILLYTFAKYIEWPKEDQTGEFIIGVFGDSEILVHLEKMGVNKTKGTQKIRVKRFKSIGDITPCHMVFVSAAKSGQLEKIRKAIGSNTSLIVSEKPNMIKKGSDFNFVLKENKLRFEMNSTLSAKRSVKISSELSKFAILI